MKVDDLVTSITEMTEEDRVQKIIERRNARRDNDEEEYKLDREVTDRDNDSSKPRFEQLIEDMSPEQAQSVMDTLD